MRTPNVPPPGEAHISSLTLLRLSTALAIAALITLQRLVGVHASVGVRMAAGYVLSMMLCISIAILGGMGGGGDGRSSRSDRLPPVLICLILSLLLALNASSAKLGPLFALMRRPPPAAAVAILVALWLGMLAWIARRKLSTATLAAALTLLVVGTRALAIAAHPFHRLDGDMLAMIGRALDELSRGRFPYADYPPPMPYLPATLLAYAPAFGLRIDLRFTNLAFEAATTLVIVLLIRPDDGDGGRAPRLGKVLLPCLMLHPIWVAHAADTQYAPTMLATTLLGLAVARGGPRLQAVALGAAAATNQMLAALAPILLASWVRRTGPRRSAGLALLAAGIALATVAPFLLWEPRRFAEIVVLSRPRLDDAMMAGRFTLLPLASRLLPHATIVGTLACLAAASRAAYAAQNPAAVLTAMATGLCAALMFQPVSFGHYFLPPIALAALASRPPGPGDGGDRAWPTPS